MGKDTVAEYKSNIGMLIAFAVLLCSFFCAEEINDFYAQKDIQPHQKTSIERQLDIVETLMSDESDSSFHVLLEKRISAKRSSITRCERMYVVFASFMLLLFLKVYLSFFLSENTKDTHRLILQYIHNQDGQKA